MTSSETAAELVARADAVLLDFDGPICSVFAGYRARDVAAEIMKRAAAARYALRPDDPGDPISVYKATTGMDPEVIAVVEDALVEEESTALSRTEPHPGIPDLVRQVREAGHRLVIVSNNGGGPVSAFINRHGLADQVENVIGRAPRRPSLLKPSPDSILRALVHLDLPPAPCRVRRRLDQRCRRRSRRGTAGRRLRQQAGQGPAAAGRRRRCDHQIHGGPGGDAAAADVEAGLDAVRTFSTYPRG